MSIIYLKLLISIDKKLQKAKNSDIFSITFFKRLSLVILMRDFYQFASVIRKVF